MRNFSPPSPLLMLRKIFRSIWIQKSEFEICETKEAAWTKYASASHEIQCLARLKNIYTGQTLSAARRTQHRACGFISCPILQALCTSLLYGREQRARLGFIYTVVRVSGPIGRHCVFSALWGVSQCAGSTENNQKQSNQIDPNQTKTQQVIQI